jgi:ribosomal protein S24E
VRRGDRAPALLGGLGELEHHGEGWVHKTVNVLDSLPKSVQPAAKKAIQEIYNAEDREHAAVAVKAFAKQYGAKFPKALKKIVDDEAELRFPRRALDLPADHQLHRVDLRDGAATDEGHEGRRLPRGGPRDVVFKLVESAQVRWRAVNAPFLVALVRAGARFERGHLAERSEVHAA